MRAADAFLVELSSAPPGAWWRQFLARVFRTLGDYPEPNQILVAELATGRLLASLDGGRDVAVEMVADLDALSADEFAQRWLPAGAWSSG